MVRRACRWRAWCACAARKAAACARTSARASAQRLSHAVRAREASLLGRFERATGAPAFCAKKTAPHRWRQAFGLHPARRTYDDLRSSRRLLAGLIAGVVVSRSFTRGCSVRATPQDLAYSNVAFFVDGDRTAPVDSAALQALWVLAARRLRARLSAVRISMLPRAGARRERLHLHRHLGLDGLDRYRPDARRGRESRSASLHRERPPGTKIGIISFAAAAGVVPPLSADHQAVDRSRSTKYRHPMAPRPSAMRSSSQRADASADGPSRHHSDYRRREQRRNRSDGGRAMARRASHPGLHRRHRNARTAD